MKQYRWDFVIAEVSRPLLGADFLWANSLLVNLRGKRLVDAETYFSSLLCEAGTPALHLSTISQTRNEYDKLLANFPEIIQPNFSTMHTKHGVEHFVKTTSPSLPHPCMSSLVTPRQVGFGQGRVLQNGSHGDHTLLK